MKKLVIAEKPSVALDISRAIGRFKKEGDHYENDEFIIAAAAGHLVELYMPEDIDKKEYGFWRLGSLPIIPEPFQIKPVTEKRSKERLQYLGKLIKRKDVSEVYNACDAGREGELIFTYIFQLYGGKKEARRIWMQSMTKDSIQKAFASPRTAEQMQGLQDAARSRSEADWLIGINGTRAITKRMFGRSKGVATVGRVQTPTLSIVLQRELEIRNFNPRPYWRILGQFEITAGEYEGVWFKEKVDKEDAHDKADRLWKEEEATALLDEIKNAPFGLISEEKKRTRQSSGRLYDLTSLQREANGRFGFSAARTLQIAQSLYERHKVLTYPRTSSQALPEDYIPTVKTTLGKLDGEYGEKAAPVLENGWVRPNKRVFNNAQITDHFAIIPTGESPAKLNTDEAKIYDMVARRFIAIFYPPAEFDVTTRITEVAKQPFKSEGKVLVIPGYLDVYGKAGKTSEMPGVSPADTNPSWAANMDAPKDQPLAQANSLELVEDTTKPPSRFTEATLLSAMEGAGKLVEDEELALAMKESGLGTPATRASTIDHLIKEKYMLRDAKFLVPTMKAEGLFEFLSAVKIEDLTQPDLTGEWEKKLLLVEQGKLSRTSFMDGIKDLTRKIVDRTKAFEENIEDAPKTSVISPTDQKPMVELLKSFKSQDGEITVYKTIGNRKLEESEVQILLNERQIGPLDGFISRGGKPFSAVLRLDPMNKVVFDFGNNDNGEDGENGKDVDLTTLEQVGVFKETGETVYEMPNAYACARSIQGDRDTGFRISRNLLGKPLPKEEIVKLLTEGKTNLIEGFKSKRTGRPFPAFLTLKAKGKLGWEFPPRPAKKAATKKTAAKKKVSE